LRVLISQRLQLLVLPLQRFLLLDDETHLSLPLAHLLVEARRLLFQRLRLLRDALLLLGDPLFQAAQIDGRTRSRLRI
jgi:hypothetical protein